MVKDPKALIAVAVVAILIIAGVAVVVNNNNNNGSKTHDNLADMSWDEIVDKAKGTDVNIGFYFDTYCLNWFNDVLVKEAKERYDINLKQVGYKTDANAIKEYNESGKISFDLFWGRASNYVNLIDIDGKGTSLILQSDWQSKMPNMKYSDGLAEGQWEAAYDSVYGAGSYSQDVSSVAPFSGSTTSFVYNKAFSDVSIAWNEVRIDFLKDSPYGPAYGKVVDYTKTITVAETGETFDGTVDETKTYSIDSVRAYRVANQGVNGNVYYGLPHNYTELNGWSKIYPGQFYLPSVLNAGTNFHTQLILEAMLYELASKGDSWIACTDSTADVWSGDLKGKYVAGDDAANKKTYMAYINEKILSHDAITPEQYAAEVPYLSAYLADTTPYWNQKYMGATALKNTNLAGNLDSTQKDFNEDTILIALNSTESLANRDTNYKCSIGVYAPETTCSNRCGLFLMEHTDNPYGAIVIANLFNDPEIQAQYYSIAGNGYNVDINTLSEEQLHNFQVRWTDWDALEKPYIKPEQIQANMVIPAVGHVETALSKAMAEYIEVKA